MNDNNDLIQPQALGFERTVLGTFIISPSLISDYAEILPPSAFYAQPNRIIWNALVEMHKNGTAIDYLTVSEYLKSSNQLAVCDQSKGLKNRAISATLTPAAISPARRAAEARANLAA